MWYKVKNKTATVFSLFSSNLGSLRKYVGLCLFSHTDTLPKLLSVKGFLVFHILFQNHESPPGVSLDKG